MSAVARANMATADARRIQWTVLFLQIRTYAQMAKRIT
jgi:hypothetical protein